MSKTNRNFSVLKIHQRVLAALLCFVFCFHSCFSLIFLEVKLLFVKHEIKHSILKEIPIEKLVKFIKPIDFETDEFEENGLMYDIVRSTKTANKTILYCFLDKEETALSFDLEKKIAQHVEKNPFKNQSKKVALSILKLVYEQITIDCFDFNIYFISNTPFYNFIASVKTIKLNVLAPPPK